MLRTRRYMSRYCSDQFLEENSIMAKKAHSANIVLQYGERSVSYDELVQNMKNKWTYDYGRKVGDIKSMELYVKPEEGRVYYVINEGEESGSFDL